MIVKDGIWGKLWRKGCGEAVAGILLLELVVGLVFAVGGEDYRIRKTDVRMSLRKARRRFDKSMKKRRYV